MKKSKRCLALLLCVMLLCSVAVIPVHAEEAVGDHVHQWEEHTDQNRYDCVFGWSWIYYKVCTICGARTDIAYRPADYTDAVGSHSYGDPVITDNSCPENPTTEQVCSECGNTLIHYGGHSWSDWAVDSEQSSPCGGTQVQYRTCALCAQRETKTYQTPMRHSWGAETYSHPGSCTEDGYSYHICTQCGAEEKFDVVKAPGHDWVGKGGDHTAGLVCSRCGEEAPGTDHTWSSWKTNDSNHWHECTQCGKTVDVEAHTFVNGSCSVCGYGKPACDHSWGAPKQFGAFNHRETCSKCGEIRTSTCTASGARTDCTQARYCVCGNIVADGNPRHYMGKWTQTAEGHERHCTSAGCTYTESGAHDIVPGTSCTSSAKCSVCGYATGSGAYGGHAWGAWINSGNGTHTRKCTRPGCTAMQSATHSAGTSGGDCTSAITCADCGAVVVPSSSGHAWGHAISAGEGGHNEHCLNPGCSAVRNSAHSGGTATCTAPAQCSVCGGYYGSRDPSNHSGGTEIRDAKAATTEAEGYTGDTYCLGCGVKIASGQSIPVLSKDHTHAYNGAWSSDSAHHWHECQCGDVKDSAAHTYSDGRCTVCGEADPNYTAEEEHIHTFTESWNADSQNHWHVCTGCGEVSDVTPHVIVTAEDGTQSCIDCGLTLKEKVQKEYNETAIAKFDDMEAGAYYTNSVGWAVTSGITNGTDETAKTFSPKATCTQAQILTMLYRAARTAEDPAFKPDGSDMKAAQAWASENGIIGAGFDPDADCTRAIAVFFMWKAADCPEAESSVTFNDVAGSDFEQAVAWAAAKGITNGTDLEKGLFSPDKTCNRGEIVTFLYRDQVEPLA